MDDCFTASSLHAHRVTDVNHVKDVNDGARSAVEFAYGRRVSTF